MAGVDASAMWELVSSLQGLNGEGSSGSTEQATCTRVDNDGTVWVRLLGAEIDTPVNGQRLADVVIGDNVTVTIEDGLLSVIGNSSRPSTSASHVEEVVGPVVQKVTEVVNVVADKASVGELQAATARIGELEADHVAVNDLTAVTGRIQSLESDHVSVADFQAEQANIDTLQANTADIDTIRANSAKVQNLTAAQLEADHATVGSLSTTYATIANLNAANGRITNLESTKANISDLEANYITADEIEATYMHANMSNSDVAWIENGTIKNGAIVSAMINDVSANKLTAGTINGSVINVTNLNADNITTGTINGQRIGEGSLSLSKLDESVYTEAEVNSIVDGLNDRIDGAIETYTGTVMPTLNNSPASSWNTTKLRDEHVGDVYYVVNSQSQQNGYCYRFTKSGSTYSWQLIKDSDVTAALQRISAAEGKITTFDSDISTLKTDTGTLTTRTTNLETRADDVDATLLDKVDVTTFNEVSDTVDAHTQTISQHTTAISNKADSSTVTAVTNRVSKNEQDISGINTTIGQLQTTVESKADGSTVSTISNKLNTVSDTVDGHTQAISSVQNTLSTKADSSTVSTLTTKVNNVSDTVDGHTQRLSSVEDTLETKADGSTVSTISTKVNNISDTVDGHTSQLQSVTSTQTSMQSTLDKTVKSSIQLWYSKANTTAPSKPTSQVTSTSTDGGAWRTVVPSYNASYPNYYYCWQYEYVDGTYGWSAVVRDIAMGESQATARTADSNASAAVSTANTASTNASTALTTANTASTNASEAKTAATTASTTASEAKTTAETAASDASMAKSNAASAVSTANSASTTATNAQNTANANIKSSVQLWFTKANGTAPSKPTSVVSTSNANTANAWNLVVPVWNSSYPHYYYCYQQQKGDGTYQWTDVVYDRATSEAQQLANTTSTNLSTLQTNYATFKQTTEQFESTVGSRLTTIESDIDGVEERVSDNETSISNNASAIALKANSSDVYTKTAVDGKITQEVSDRTAAITAKANEITSTVSQTYTTKQESQQAIDYVANAENNYGFQYHKDIVVFGESDKYYPVYFANIASQTVTHEVMIMRNYSEQAPDDWNTSTHKGSLNLRIKWNFGGWGGATYKAEITVFSEMYSTILGDVVVGTDGGMFSIVFLRGGGMVGALYHVYSEVPLSRNSYMQNAGVVGENDVPYVGLTEGTVYAKSGETYQWAVRAPLTAPNTTHINQLYTVQRVIEAETAIVQNAESIALRAKKSELGAVEAGSTNMVSNIRSNWQPGSLTNSSYGYYSISSRIIPITETDNGRTWSVKAGTKYTFRAINSFDSTTKLYVGIHEQNSSGTHLKDSGWQLCSENGYSFETLADTTTLRLVVMSGDPDGVVTSTALLEHMESGKLSFFLGERMATSAELKIATDGITSTVSKISGVKYLEATTAGWALADIKAWCAEGFIGNWNVKSAENVRVGDTVLIKGYDVTRQCNIYIKGTVNSISGNSLNITSHGYEDILPSDVAISSINQSAESVKIQASRVEIDGTATFNAIKSSTDAAYDAKGSASTAKSEAISAAANDATAKVNSVMVGGRNLLFEEPITYDKNSYLAYTIQSSKSAKELGAGTTITIQLWDVELDSNSAGIGGYWGGGSSGQLFRIKPNENGYCSATITIPESTASHAQGANKFLQLYNLYNGHSESSLYIGRWKLEIGNKATDWSPAPEDIVSRTQRIWYRWNSATAPAAPTSWVTKGDDGNALWTKMHVSITESYKYIYTCEQYEMADGTLGHTDVLLDNTITVIDGGNIITGTVKANAISATSGTFNVANIPTLNADKIDATNLHVSAANIDGTLTIGKLPSTVAQKSDISNAVDAIEIGGRNLLAYSGTGKNWSYSTFANGVYTRSTTATSESYVEGRTVAPLELGETYTFSAWMKTNGQVSSVDMFLYDHAVKTIRSKNLGEITTEWAFYTLTVTMPDSWVSGTNTVDGWHSRFDNNGSKTSGTEAILYVKKPKLEKGNKATDWSPAPEDVDADIEEVATNVEAASESAGDAMEQALAATGAAETAQSAAEEAQSVADDALRSASDIASSLSQLDQSINQWATFTPEKGLTLGASDSDFDLNITNTRAAFRYQGNVTAYSSGTEYVAPRMTSDEFHVGGFMWTTYGDAGGMALKWVGLGA